MSRYDAVVIPAASGSVGNGVDFATSSTSLAIPSTTFDRSGNEKQVTSVAGHSKPLVDTSSKAREPASSALSVATAAAGVSASNSSLGSPAETSSVDSTNPTSTLDDPVAYNVPNAIISCCIIPNRLYFCVVDAVPNESKSAQPAAASSATPTKMASSANATAASASNYHYFSIDQLLRYQPFYQDFGPLNLGCTYRFCTILRTKLTNPKLESKKIVYYCGSDPQCIANAATLVGIYLVSFMNYTPDQVETQALSKFEPFIPFSDASQFGTTFKLYPMHCIRGFYHAMRLGWINLETFDIESYEYYEAVENGDLNVIIPNKFIAFSSPHATNISEDGFAAFTPENYIPIFARLGVNCVIRFNNKTYDRRKFLHAGIAHYDMFFEDGSNPPPHILSQFLKVTENHASGVIAVHCKAGLGRTGTLIGCYMIKNFGFKAHEAIGWLRLCRPGSVIAQQQHYLAEMEATLRAMNARIVPPTDAGSVHTYAHASHTMRSGSPHSSRGVPALRSVQVSIPARPSASASGYTITPHYHREDAAEREGKSNHMYDSSSTISARRQVPTLPLASISSSHSSHALSLRSPRSAYNPDAQTAASVSSPSSQRGPSPRIKEINSSLNQLNLSDQQQTQSRNLSTQQTSDTLQHVPAVSSSRQVPRIPSVGIASPVRGRSRVDQSYALSSPRRNSPPTTTRTVNRSLINIPTSDSTVPMHPRRLAAITGVPQQTSNSTGSSSVRAATTSNTTTTTSSQASTGQRPPSRIESNASSNMSPRFMRNSSISTSRPVDGTQGSQTNRLSGTNPSPPPVRSRLGASTVSPGRIVTASPAKPAATSVNGSILSPRVGYSAVAAPDAGYRVVGSRGQRTPSRVRT